VQILGAGGPPVYGNRRTPDHVVDPAGGAASYTNRPIEYRVERHLQGRLPEAVHRQPVTGSRAYGSARLDPVTISFSGAAARFPWAPAKPSPRLPGKVRRAAEFFAAASAPGRLSRSMMLPAVMSVPRLDPDDVVRVRKLCDAIVESARIGLDATFLVESLNDSTANELCVDDVVRAAAKIGTQTLACLAMSPPTPRVEASTADWTIVIDRIRTETSTGYERAWWLELIACASDHEDATARVLAADGRASAEIAAELFG